MTKPSPGVALFKGLGNNEIHMIRAAAAKRTFQASQIIIRAEEHAVRLFVIEVGSLDIFSEQAITLRSLGFGATIDSRMEP